MWYRFVLAGRDEYLTSIGADEEIIDFVNENTEKYNVLSAAIRKNPQITIPELKSIIEPKPKQKNIAQEKINAVELALKSKFENINFDPKFEEYFIKQSLKKLRSDPNDTFWLRAIRNELGDIYDFYKAIIQDNPRFEINSYSLDQIEQMSQDWHKSISEKGKGSFYLPLKPANIVHNFKNGWKIVNVNNENDLNVEGSLMHHCVGSYSDQVEDNQIKILSLRDPSNKPHVTIECSQDMKEVFQIKGVANSEPKPEYKKLLKEYFSKTNMKGGDESMSLYDYVSDLRWEAPADYDRKLMKIFEQSFGERNEYGLLKRQDGMFEDVIDSVASEATSSKAYKHIAPDIAHTLTKYAHDKDLETLNKLKNQSKTISPREWKDISLLYKLQHHADALMQNFYEDYYDSDVLEYPTEEDYEDYEDYENALKAYEQDQSYYMKKAISNDFDAHWADSLIDSLNYFAKDEKLINLQNEVVKDQMLAFNLSKYLKQAINTQYPQESLFFKPWHEGGIITDEQGNPKTLYHGTIKPFDQFNPSEFSPGGAFGQSIYTTDNPEDASENYANPTSPEWKAKTNDLIDKYVYEGIDSKSAEQKAREQIITQSKPNVIPLYGSMKKPAHFSEFSPKFEMYQYNEELDEFYPGAGEEVLNELQNTMYDYDFQNPETTIQELRETLGEEFNFFDLMKAIQNNSSFYDSDISFGDFVKILIQNLKYDGIIIDVNDYWPQMVNKPTKHYMFFHPTQVKSPFNKTFDPKTPILNASSIHKIKNSMPVKRKKK